MADGTDRLCWSVYGREAMARDYLGGGEARMLHHAADLLSVEDGFAAALDRLMDGVATGLHLAEKVEHLLGQRLDAIARLRASWA